MCYSSVFFLLKEIGKYALRGVKIFVDIYFLYVVNEVEIKVINSAFFELLLKYLLGFIHIGEVVAREF